MKKIFYIGVLALSLISCKTQKDVSETEINNKLKKEKFISTLKKNVDFSTLKVKATANIESGETSYPSVALTLYFNKDEQIWANASIAFIMIARADIKPSGFRMYEKPGKTYIDSDFNYVNNLLRINFIDYNTLELLLMGKLFFPLIGSDYNFSVENHNYILSSVKPVKVGEGKDSRNFNRKISYDADFNLKQVVLEDSVLKTYLQIDYGDYVNFEGNVLPKSIKIFIKDKKESKISLNYNKFEVVKMDTPFEIPKGYTQREIH